MKRAYKFSLGLVVLVAALTCLWCLLCPVLFPQRTKSANDKYQAWLADHPAAKK
jgi:hypothetical protein